MDCGKNLEPALALLASLCREVSAGNYARADELFSLTAPEGHPALIAGLAESFGLMMVSVEAREFSLRQALEELEEARKKLAEENVVLKKRLTQLTVEIDQSQKEREVCEITESEYFKKLSQKARALREGM